MQVEPIVAMLTTGGAIFSIYVLVTLLRSAFETIEMLRAENEELRAKQKEAALVEDFEDAAVINAKIS